MLQKFTTGPQELVGRLNEIVNVVNALSTITGDGMLEVKRSPTGFHLSLNQKLIEQYIPKIGKGGGKDVDVAKLFQIESSATGPGIYNCLPAVIDSSEWDVEDQHDIIDVKQEGDPLVDVTETEQVLNLDEVANSTTWALFENFDAGDFSYHIPDQKDYKCKVAHCAGGCTPWSPGDWAVGNRCRYNNHAYLLETNPKDINDTSPPTLDDDWDLDDDEPNVGNSWTSYWELVTDSALSVGTMIIAFNVTDDQGNVRLVGRAFGVDFIKQFFEECS